MFRRTVSSHLDQIICHSFNTCALIRNVVLIATRPAPKINRSQTESFEREKRHMCSTPPETTLATTLTLLPENTSDSSKSNEKPAGTGQNQPGGYLSEKGQNSDCWLHRDAPEQLFLCSHIIESRGKKNLRVRVSDTKKRTIYVY